MCRRDGHSGCTGATSRSTWRTQHRGGVLEGEAGLFRMESYTRRGSNIVDVVIPAGLTPGSYAISLVAKPGNTYFTASIDLEVTMG